ncbi:hypothetical protein SKAU_G00202430 [Synaphobranchus kaupii]|uniref:Uncharacterized protein n=1 Tax=Synaphobranchus kaupii TaxID=118154 RepID=A0A9Q1FFS6_SYNKA|nr:hypothetical protein SKAU_G00202430 [Synaphobranchus kaupii]
MWSEQDGELSVTRRRVRNSVCARSHDVIDALAAWYCIPRRLYARSLYPHKRTKRDRTIDQMCLIGLMWRSNGGVELPAMSRADIQVRSAEVRRLLITVRRCLQETGGFGWGGREGLRERLRAPSSTSMRVGSLTRTVAVRIDGQLLFLPADSLETGARKDKASSLRCTVGHSTAWGVLLIPVSP